MRKVTKYSSMEYKASRFSQISFMIVRTLRWLSSRFLHYNQNIVKDWSLMNFTHFWWIKSWWVLVAYLYILKLILYFKIFQKTNMFSFTHYWLSWGEGEGKSKYQYLTDEGENVGCLKMKNLVWCLVGRMAVLTNTLWFEPIDKWFMA